MKYGIRERISGAVILAALAVIFLPMLFDEPAPRGERPEPVLTIEQPIPVDQRDVDAPEPPANLASDGQVVEPATEHQLGQSDAAPTSQPTPSARDESSDQAAPTRDDPIAAIAAQSSASPPQGEAESEASATPAGNEPRDGWVVQVGSFGKPGNATRLVEELKSQGFEAYKRPRDNDLTTVYVGPFASSEAGERVRTKLKEEINIQGLLIRTQEE
ncbi:DedD protein [Chromohalobacter marismortui]|uniref:DedD protein n=1 Tax=Chromohalobacter marismortui TaxID=42055 RepID=A0A4V3F4S9_9GAMM|nr:MULTISPECIES: SPOR domain-containing protein [Chromohalobacter]MCI0510647.1 SPOR domain-containing protein [Chromohalobacter sp.]MCI0591962.1 SPOR domain-containing protein [Chromohalobacter sp.]TDU24776.1 DedD protein [Chromohalobacter marismortui]